MVFLDMNTARKVLEYPHLGSLLRGLFTEKVIKIKLIRVERTLPGFVSNSEKVQMNSNTNTITKLSN